jgi:predicted small lipoprotein YifL
MGGGGVKNTGTLMALVALTAPLAACGRGPTDTPPAAVSSSAAPSATVEASAPSLVGAWRSRVQFADGAYAGIKDLEFLYVYNAGGTMTESSNYDGAPPVPPAYGAWRQTAPRRFESRYEFFVTKAPAAFDEVAKGGGWMPNGRGTLTESIELAADGGSFESTMVFELFDASGKPVEGGGRATGQGVRIRL